MHVEYVVLGPPVSNQQTKPKGIANFKRVEAR